MASEMVLRQLQLVGSTGAIRAASFQGRDHVVVPTVALMQGVIWPVNAPSAEFVPTSVLRAAPQGWNGRPCVGDHPQRNRALVSANSPLVLEEESFGTVFNARILQDRLIVEAWLDPTRAVRVGPVATRVLERIRNGTPVEVSVGAFVTTETVNGTYNGKPYTTRWTSLVPDHLAFLPEGTRGACSVEMGCGAPRAAKGRSLVVVPRYAVTATGLALLAESEEPIRTAFDSSQPRVPAGSAGGGQWTDGVNAKTGTVVPGGGGGEADAGSARGPERTFTSDEELRATFYPPTDEGTYQRPMPLKVASIDQAVEHVLAGHVVEVADVASAHTVVAKLAQVAQDMKRQGKDAPNFDLCNVSVAGTNLFCADSVRSAKYPDGVPRIEMPQLAGKPIPGSAADKLPRVSKDSLNTPGEVNGADQFIAHMADLKIRTKDDTVPASSLRASQHQLRGAVVAGMMTNANYDPAADGFIFVSRDNYVIDGHHRWAAIVGRDAADGKLGDLTIRIKRVDAPIAEVLFLGRAWAERFGIAQGAGPAKPRASRQARTRAMATVAAALLGVAVKPHTQPEGQMRSLQNWRVKLSSLFAGRQPTAMPRNLSDADLRQALTEALDSAHADHAGIAEVYPTESRLVFARQGDGAADPTYFGQAYTVAPTTHQITLDGTPEELRATVTFTAARECGCHNDKESGMHRNHDRIQALMANADLQGAFKDQPFLEGLSDERLAALEGSCGPKKKTDAEMAEEKAAADKATADEATAKAAAAAPKDLTETEILAKYPGIGAIVAAHRVAELAKRTEIISGLAASQDAYTEAELTAMPTEQLEKVAKLAKVEVAAPASYAMAGVPRAAAAAITDVPDPWAAGLAVMAGRK